MSSAEKYSHIAKAFSEVPGVEVILMQETQGEVSLCMTNDRSGDARRVFEFPLKTTFYVDYATAPEDCPNNYDIAEFEEADAMVALGLAKATKLFGSAL